MFHLTPSYAAQVEPLLPVLLDELDRMAESVASRVATALADSTLSPETALLAWVEYMGYKRLKKRICDRIRATLTTNPTEPSNAQA